MATFAALLVPVSMLLGNIDGRTTRIVVINPRDGTTDGTFHRAIDPLPTPATWVPATPPVIAPASIGAIAVPGLVQPDWPDFHAENRSYTVWRDSTMSLPRLKDRLLGQVANPRFVCSSLAFGLKYKLTVNLEEGPIGGPFSAYAPLERSYIATAATMEISLYLPIAAQGREIRLVSYSNVRDYS